MIKGAPALSATPVPLGRGLNKALPSNHALDKGMVEMRNFRVSADGTRIEKRLGAANEKTDFGMDVYGYATYLNSGGSFCELAVLESEIQRKVGAGAWTKIHDFVSGGAPATIAHPQKILEVQGKQLIINEVNSRMVHFDGNDYQIGIDKPAGGPWVRLDYPDTVVVEPFTYADTTALDLVWTDGDTGTGASSQATFDGQQATRLYVTGGSGVARRYRQLATTAKRFKIELKFYLDDVTTSDGMFFFSFQYSADHRFTFCADAAYMNVGQSAPSRTSSIGASTLNTWHSLVFYVDTENELVEVHLLAAGGTPSAATYFGTFKGCQANDSHQGETILLVTGVAQTTDVYIDYLNIYRSADNDDTGVLHRYGVTYGRSGNYPNEGNPYKSTVGGSFVGSGLNDLTIDSDSEYTGGTKRTIEVQIDGTGATDTYKVSYDGGLTWAETLMPIASAAGAIYLSYGVQVSFAAVTGHTSGDYWRINCLPCSVQRGPEETVTLSSIPTSLDSQVDERRIYRSTAGGVNLFWMATISNNTATSFAEATPDSELGAAVEEDHDILPDGKFACWWDNRLWVLDDNSLYYSQTDNPEAFYTDALLGRVITITKTDQDDETTGLIDFKDSLYVFKRNNIFVIMKKPDGSYGRYELTGGIGCVAPWSLIVVNDLLMFMSYRGIEIYNGAEAYTLPFSTPILPVLKNIDTTAYDKIMAAEDKVHGEVWFNLPDVTGETNGVIVVYNYLADCWYEFAQDKIISWLGAVRNSSKKLVNKYATRDGFLRLAESGYLDGAATITASVRTPWLTFAEHGDIHMVEVEYEIPASKTLTGSSFLDMQASAAKSHSFTGDTPGATDQDLRRVIYGQDEMGLHGKFYAYKLANSENVGGEVKINAVTIWHSKHALKGEVSPD